MARRIARRCRCGDARAVANVALKTAGLCCLNFGSASVRAGLGLRGLDWRIAQGSNCAIGSYYWRLFGRGRCGLRQVCIARVCQPHTLAFSLQVVARVLQLRYQVIEIRDGR